MSASIVTVPSDADYFTIERHFAAPRRLIWRCYTEPRHLVRFWGPRDTKASVTVDLRVGGVWWTRWDYPDGNSYSYSSVYLELAEPERIHYRDAPDGWGGGLDGLPPTMLVSSITLSGTDDGTNVLVHVRCTSAAARDETVARGFAAMVDLGNERLDEYLLVIAEEEN